MKTTVCYMSQLRRSAGVPREVLDADGRSTVQDFVSKVVCDRHPNLAKTILNDTGDFHPVLMMFVGEDQIDLNTPHPLKDGDEITLMFPISGG